jgi:glutamine phosphoribosylpyrophosphate amidotransferase
VALEGTSHHLGVTLPPAVVFIDLRQVHTSVCRARCLRPCIFEYVYLARPDSVMDLFGYTRPVNLGAHGEAGISTCRQRN